MKNILISTQKNLGRKTRAKGLKFLGALSAILLAVVMLFANVSPALAVPASSTAGPKDAGIGADVATVGSIAWTNPGNITAADTSYATAIITAGATTHYLRGTNYGFAIPAGATINGITVNIRRSSIGGTTTDSEVKLVRAGVVETTNKSVGAVWSNPGFGVAPFGGTGDLWGAAWTPADINNAGFGVVLSATDSAGGTASVDYMQITITYTPVGTAHSAVNLGTAGNFAVLAQTAITNANHTTVSGNVGIFPNALSSITGFTGPTMDSSGVFATSPDVTGGGRIYAAAMTPPTPDNMNTATNDKLTAYTTANGVAPDATNLSGGNIGGLTFSPGCYRWSTAVNIATDIYLTGGPSDVWIFQVQGPGGLTVASGCTINLSGGAVASNVFWVVAGSPGATLGTTSTFNGTILSAYAIIMNGGGTLNGRALAASAVNLNGAIGHVTFPAPGPGATTTLVTLTVGSEPSVYGTSVTFTATVTGSSPTGPVQFKDGVDNLGSLVNLGVSFQATYTTSTLSVIGGGHNITAVYTGDFANLGSTSPAYNHVVNPKPITVTAGASSKVYDGLLTSPGVPLITSGGPLVGTDTASWVETYDNKNVGTTHLMTVTPAAVNDGNSGANYTVSYNTIATGIITTRPITVTADGKVKVIGTTDPALTYVASGSLGSGDTFVGILSGSLTRVAGETPGYYQILLGTVSAGANYNITYIGANLYIYELMITAPPTTSTIPPTTSTIPPTTSTIPPTTSTIPPTTSTIPPTTSTIPPTTSTAPPTTSGITKIVFTTSAQTRTAGTTSGMMSIQVQNASGSPVNVAANTTINLTSSSASGKFYSDAAGTIQITSVTISSGNSSASFYYTDSSAGTPTITAAESPSAGWTDATQQEAINATTPPTTATTPPTTATTPPITSNTGTGTNWWIMLSWGIIGLLLLGLFGALWVSRRRNEES